jgi:crotonobetainyl-CoA:carnitine CoA-transferase CaiB-like acyl-CoA transferase
MSEDDLPLAGTHVVDFANGYAGPLAAMTLADLGANVIKVEPIGKGDLTRDLSPSMFAAANRNKRSIAVDLKTPIGLDIAHRLVGRADILVESFRPGIMDKLGLGYDDVRADHPALIYASINGFGSRSRHGSRRALDAVAQADGGMIASNEGIEAPFTVVDTTTGIFLAHGILAALVKRGRTGHGEHIEAALLPTALALQAVQLADFSTTGAMLTPSERARRAPTAAVFPAADGPIFVAAHYEEHWRELVRVLGEPGLAEDDRFATRSQRVANGPALTALLNERFQSQPRQYWFEQLNARGVMVAPVRDHAEVLDDRELKEHGWLVEDGSGPTLVSLPYTVGAAVLPVRHPPPRLGEHSTQVLHELGYDDGEIDQIFAADPAPLQQSA